MSNSNLSTLGEPVHVEAHSDDFVVKVQFDGRAWLAQAELSEILSLADIGFRGDYAADDVYHHAVGVNDPDVQPLVNYLLKDPVMPNGDTCGFEVVVDEDQALEWLALARPDVHARIMVTRFIAESEGITATALDDLIHDEADKGASEINNRGVEAQLELLGRSGENPGDFEDGELDDSVHDHFSNLASEANNSGVDSQLYWLFYRGWSAEDVLAELDGAVPTSTV